MGCELEGLAKEDNLNVLQFLCLCVLVTGSSFKKKKNCILNRTLSFVNTNHTNLYLFLGGTGLSDFPLLKVLQIKEVLYYRHTYETKKRYYTRQISNLSTCSDICVLMFYKRTNK